MLRYTVVLEPTNEPDHPGCYYAHVPALDLTTHGEGVEGARKAAEDLIAGWIAEARTHGEAIPEEREGFISHIEVAADAVHAA